MRGMGTPLPRQLPTHSGFENFEVSRTKMNRAKSNSLKNLRTWTNNTRRHPNENKSQDSLTPNRLAISSYRKPSAGPVGLPPFAVNQKLRNRPLARALPHFVRRSRSVLDIDFFEGNIVLFQKALSLPAIGTPERGIDDDLHGAM